MGCTDLAIIFYFNIQYFLSVNWEKHKERSYLTKSSEVYQFPYIVVTSISVPHMEENIHNIFYTIHLVFEFKIMLNSYLLFQAEADMKRKLELIYQIRAVEIAPAPRRKMLDLTSTAGARLLSEMSIAEVRDSDDQLVNTAIDIYFIE